MYPKPQEPRPPPSSTNAYTRLLSLDMVMAMQAEFEPREHVVLGAPLHRRPVKRKWPRKLPTPRRRHKERCDECLLQYDATHTGAARQKEDKKAEEAVGEPAHTF